MVEGNRFAMWPTGAQRAQKTAVFDLDGTLVDTMPFVAAEVARILANESRHGGGGAGGTEGEGKGEGGRERSAEEIQARMEQHGETAASIFQRALNPASAARATLQFRQALRERSYADAAFHGARETLEALRCAGFLLGVATNRPQREAEVVLRECGLHDLFDTVRGLEDGTPAKPDPYVVCAALRDLLGAEVGLEKRGGLAPPGTVMVGDTDADAEAARAAGITNFVRVGQGGVGDAGDGSATVLRRCMYPNDLFFLDAPGGFDTQWVCESADPEAQRAREFLDYNAHLEYDAVSGIAMQWVCTWSQRGDLATCAKGTNAKEDVVRIFHGGRSGSRFDAAWYVREYNTGDEDPVLHFITRGAMFGCKPAPEVNDVAAFLRVHADLRLMVDCVRQNGFDPKWYAAMIPQTELLRLDAKHYLESNGFDAGSVDAEAHWFAFGKTEGRLHQFKPISALQHWVKYGFYQGLAPCAEAPALAPTGKSVVIVGNAQHGHDVSGFVDACDYVVRMSTQNGLGTFTGTKTTLYVEAERIGDMPLDRSVPEYTGPGNAFATRGYAVARHVRVRNVFPDATRFYLVNFSFIGACHRLRFEWEVLTQMYDAIACEDVFPRCFR